jgi:hypothetical protein
MPTFANACERFGQKPFKPRVLVLRSSSVFNRLASETSSPPNLACVDAGVADAMLPAQVGNRHASLLLNILMICSSEKRLRFMLWSLS